MNADAKYPPGAPFIPTWMDDAPLSTWAFRLLAHLWRRWNPKDRKCWPSAEDIAESIGWNRKTVFKYLNELEPAGLVTRLPKPFGGSNRYALNVPTVPRDGTVGGGESSHETGLNSSHATGLEPSHETGREGTQLKVPKERSVGGPAPTAHTLPLPDWFQSVAAKHPTKDAERCWPAFVARQQENRHKPTPERFDSWLERELTFTRKPERKGESIPPEPTGWQLTTVYKGSHLSDPDHPLFADKWVGLGPECRQLIINELEASSQKPEQAGRRP